MIDFTNSKLYSVKEEVGIKSVLRKEGKYWFGPFPESKFYDIEKSEDVVRDRKKQDKMKSVEFVLLSNLKIGVDKTPSLAFVELKSSVPNLISKEEIRLRLTLSEELRKFPDIVSEKLASFLGLLPNEFQKSAISALDHSWIVPKSIEDVCDKFINSWRLLLSVAYDREKSDSIPPEILRSVQNVQTPLVFILILDVDESQIIEATKPKDGVSTNDKTTFEKEEKKRRDAKATINKVLETIKLSLKERLNKRLVIERKICQTHVFVITTGQARNMKLISSTLS